MMNKNQNRAGVSLIEVLVVIVILTIGIFSVIRIFPPGFLINKRTEELSRATRLAAGEMARVQSNSVNLPDGIIPVTVVNAGGSIAFAIDAGASPDDLSEQPREATGLFPWSYYWSNVNKIRRIIGETVRIPIPSPTIAGQGSIYLLRHAPFMDVPWNGLATSLFIQSTPLTRVVVQDTTTTTPSNVVGGNTRYAINYNTNQVGFPLDTKIERQYLISYSYLDAANVVQTVIDQVVPPAGMFPPNDLIPPGYDDWIGVPVPGNSKIIPYTETIGRRFIDRTAGVFSPNNPFEFKVGSPRIANLANAGVVVFNPLAYDYSLTAKVDYDVLDWHIIREDRSMPAAPPYQIALGLKGIKKIDQTEDDQSNYDGLLYGVPRSNNVGALLVYNATTGELIPEKDASNNVNYSINYKDGTVTFSDAFGSVSASGAFRFFYRAEGDWAVAVQKATATYVRSGTSAITFGQFYLGSGGPAGGSRTRIYFPISEAGKTVSIREIWYSSSGGSAVKVANESYNLNANRSTFEIVGGVPLTWLDIYDKHKDAVAWDYTSTGQPALGVQGISLRTRVIWRSTATVNQSAVGSIVTGRWRKFDLDTILVRSLGQ